MELFKQINNEALDEDMRIQKQVIERLKKQVALFNQPYKAPIELSDTVLNNIQRYIINFDDNLNKTLNDVNKRGEQKEDTGDLVLNYNLLANYLDKVNFNLANVNDKRDIIELLDEIAPKLGKVLSIIKNKGYTDIDLVEKVFNNFKNRTYNVILEKERVQQRGLTEKEKKQLEQPLIDFDETEKPKVSEIVDTISNVKQRLDTLIKKCEKILLEKPKGNKKFETIINQSQTYLDLYNSKEKVSLREVVAFLDRKEKVVNEYLNKGKSLLEQDMGEAEAEPEPEQAFKLAPALQQGAEETQLQLPQAQEGSGRKRYYKKT
jgi:hypothetical protein